MRRQRAYLFSMRDFQVPVHLASDEGQGGVKQTVRSIISPWGDAEKNLTPLN